MFFNPDVFSDNWNPELGIRAVIELNKIDLVMKMEYPMCHRKLCSAAAAVF